MLQAGGFQDVTVHVEDHEEDVADGGETVSLSLSAQENSSTFMDDFFKQV